MKKFLLDKTTWLLGSIFLVLLPLSLNYIGNLSARVYELEKKDALDTTMLKTMDKKLTRILCHLGDKITNCEGDL